MRLVKQEEQVEELDEEFLYHWLRGNELFAAGDYAPACDALDRALRLRRGDGKVLGLIGLARYRLGQFDKAVETYGALVDATPEEVGPRINLGLALMKARRFAEAARHLTIALERRPDHKKAMGCLGLALLEMGDAAKAREWFARAGSELGVARCDRLLSSGAAETAGAPLPPEVPQPERLLPEDPAQAGTDSALARFAAARLVPPAGPGISGVSLHGASLILTVNSGWLASLERLYAMRGSLELAPAMKRHHGRTTLVPFGEGSRRVHHVRGAGSLLYHLDGRRFTALEIDADAGYFREEAVLAFEESVAFENGRVSGPAGQDLHLLYLGGRGRFVLETHGEIAAVQVSAQEPLSVWAGSLVGWLGDLAPRLAPAGASAAPGIGCGALVELTGQGCALVDLEAAGAAARSGLRCAAVPRAPSEPTVSR